MNESLNACLMEPLSSSLFCSLIPVVSKFQKSSVFGSKISAVELLGKRCAWCGSSVEFYTIINIAFSIMVSELLQDSLPESILPNLDFIRYKPSST